MSDPIRYLDSDDASGIARGQRARARGGAAQNLLTIGSFDNCWCDKKNGHTWPGMEQGQPHPREDKKMTVVEKRHGLEADKLDVRDLRKFDRSVAKMVTDLVNIYGVPYRIQSNGVHVLLYPPGDYTPGERGARHKVTASRGSVQTMESLEKWCQKYIAPALVNQQAEMLVARFNDPAKVRRLKAAERPSGAAVAAADQVPTPAPAAQETAASQAQQPDLGPAPDGYEQWTTNTMVDGKYTTGVPINWWKKIGADEWKCKSCDYVFKGLRLFGAHQRVHNMSTEERSELATKASRVAQANAEAKVASPTKESSFKVFSPAEAVESRQAKSARTRKIRKAVRMISEVTGVDLGDSAMLNRKIAKLTADLEKVTKERDDAKARLDLIKEGLRA